MTVGFWRGHRLTKRCRLSWLWLTNSALVHEPKCGGRGGGCWRVSANEYSWAHGAQINFGDLTSSLTYDGLLLILLVKSSYSNGVSIDSWGPPKNREYKYRLNIFKSKRSSSRVKDEVSSRWPSSTYTTFELSISLGSPLIQEKSSVLTSFTDKKKKYIKIFYNPWPFLPINSLCTRPEAKFLDVIETKVLRVFLLAIHNHHF